MRALELDEASLPGLSPAAFNMPPSWACCGAKGDSADALAGVNNDPAVLPRAVRVHTVSNSYRNFELRHQGTPRRGQEQLLSSVPVLSGDVRRDHALLRVAARLALLSYVEDIKSLQVRYLVWARCRHALVTSQLRMSNLPGFPFLNPLAPSRHATTTSETGAVVRRTLRPGLRRRAARRALPNF